LPGCKKQAAQKREAEAEEEEEERKVREHGRSSPSVRPVCI
jgi:hypothetical protein